MRYMRTLVILLVCGLMTVVGRQKELTVREITDRLQKKFDSMQDATIRFTQHVKFGFSKIEQSTQGALTMKRPNKYRVELEHQTIVTNGSVVWSYSPANKQVLIDRYKENQNSLSPEQFLLNLPAQYYTTLLGKEKVENAETYVLKLVPKDDQSFIKSVKMWVEDGTWVVRKVQIIDVNDTETVYTVVELKINTRVNDALFTFTPPAGTEVVDLR
jgi:chaperone LolA